MQVDKLVARLIRVHMRFVGVIGMLVVSVSLMASGVIKFSAFPNVEGDILEARILMPTGTPFSNYPRFGWADD